MLMALLAGAMVCATVIVAAAAITGTQVGRARRRFDCDDEGPPRIARAAAPPWVADRLADVDVAWSPDTAWSVWLTGAGAAAAAALLVGGPGLVVVCLVTACAGPALAWTALRHRADERLESAVPGALDEMARSLRSGASLVQAISEAAATAPPLVRPHLAAVSAAAERGLGLVEALEAWGRRRPLPSVRLSVAALCLAAESGGAQARAIDGVAMTVRQRLGVASEAKALATQARLSGVVIAAAPVAFGALASVSDPRVGHLLFRTPVGWALLLAGLGLDGVGAAWMARLTRPKL